MRVAILLSSAIYSKYKGKDGLISKVAAESLTTLNNITNNHDYDIVVVGGGIVGAATARELSIRYPKLRLALLDKENGLAYHQSGHNSGVIHSGIYYKPGSLRAKLCVDGLALTYKYCDEKSIPYKKVGKLIVAINDNEVKLLDDLYKRGIENGVKDLKLINENEIQNYEPNCIGLKAIWSPHTGIVDWGLVNQYYGKDFHENGGKIYTNFQVDQFKLENESGLTRIRIISNKHKQNVTTKYVITAAGLHSDRIAKLTGCNPNPRIVPFRGEYLVLKPHRSYIVRGNIYPVPDPRFPFLGVHFTPRMDGSVWLGPNAVLALKREGYSWSDISIRDTFDALSFKGLRKLIYKYMSPGLSEMYRSWNMRAQVKLLEKYVPSLMYEDVMRGPTGVRAQAMDENGNLIEDFVFDSGEGELGKRCMHIRNAPSPAATSSLAIGKAVVDEVAVKFSLDKVQTS